MGFRYFLSYGGGIDSTALLLYLLENGEPLDEVVYVVVDDWPDSWDYIGLIDRWLWKNYGMEITYLIPHVEGTTSILEYSIKRRIAPLRQNRWCSDKFKVRTFDSYVLSRAKRPVVYIGIDAGEIHRAKVKRRGRIRFRYPLIEAGITRDKAKKIIRNHGLPVPPKSGCYFCPFQRRIQAMVLAKKYPQLWEHVKMLNGFVRKKDTHYAFSIDIVEDFRKKQVLLEVI